MAGNAVNVEADPLDLVIVGAGPCGLAAAVAAKEAGLAYVVLDRGCITESLTHYPYYMTFFSTAERLEIGGVPFTIPEAKPTRREALAYYRRVVAHHGLRVRQYEEVTRVEATPVVGQKSGEWLTTAKPGRLSAKSRAKWPTNQVGATANRPEALSPSTAARATGTNAACTRTPS